MFATLPWRLPVSNMAVFRDFNAAAQQVPAVADVMGEGLGEAVNEQAMAVPQGKHFFTLGWQRGSRSGAPPWRTLSFGWTARPRW
jgi:hypothetical protein